MSTERRPAVLVNGKVRPLPAGDTVKGVPTSAELDAKVPDTPASPATKYLRGDGTWSTVTASGTGFTLENRTDDPGSPAVGQIWLRTDL